MSGFTTHPRRPKVAPKHPAIILASDQHDARVYAERHGETNYIAVTPRSIAHARGRLGPVYATRRARAHYRYTEMLMNAKACGELIPRKSRDRRVA